MLTKYQINNYEHFELYRIMTESCMQSHKLRRLLPLIISILTKIQDRKNLSDVADDGLK